MKIKFVLIFVLLTLFISAKVKILMPSSILELISSQQNLLNLFQPLIQNNESAVIHKFISKEANFAIVRGDIFSLFIKNKKMNNCRYHIIGKISEKSILYFFTKINNRMETIESLQNKRISIGMLGDETNTYLKNILEKYKMPHLANMISDNFYHSVQSLKSNKIDAMFMFGMERNKNKFKKYIQSYPKNFSLTLKDTNGLICKDKSCYTWYYIIASDSVGQQVMHNIYEQVMPILSNNKELTSNLGQYYIDTKQKKYPHIIQDKLIDRDEIKSPNFGRTPWMDIAIKEAILGKGSSENVLPMLDLSYKYIRFSKGDKGITTAPNDSKFGAWCAAYICWTLDKSGYEVHKKGRMGSQSFRYFKNKLYKKINTPIFGAITLYTSKKNPLYGHVGYLFGKTKNGNNILLGGNQNNRLKFASYNPQGFGSYRFNGFYIPIDYVVKKRDKLTSKDIYKSVKSLNKQYGIEKSRQSKKVR